MNETIIAYFASMNKQKVITISVIAAIVIAVAIFLIVKLKGGVKSIVNDDKNNKLIDEINKEQNADDITLTQLQFNAYASSLKKALQGLGTDEKKIYNVFQQMNTRSDVLQLIKTFGVVDGENLNEWLNDDLSAKEIDKINQILAEKGINYKF